MGVRTWSEMAHAERCVSEPTEQQSIRKTRIVNRRTRRPSMKRELPASQPWKSSLQGVRVKHGEKANYPIIYTSRRRSRGDCAETDHILHKTTPSLHEA